jgi:hypothetical protein
VTATPPNSTNPNPLGAFAGLVTVLTIFLFFTGWVYRWAYFGFFEIELNSLNFSAQSFLLVPIQLILGDIGKLGLAILATFVVIKATLWAVQSFPSKTSPGSDQSKRNQFLKGVHQFPLLQGVRWLTNVFPQPLQQELVIVVWVLIALFYLAQNQGREDALRDAVDKSTTRPIITLISPSDKFALGAILNEKMLFGGKKSTDYAPLKENLRIFGDVNQFNMLYGKGINRTDSNNSPPVAWRLLIESGNWLYIFQTLQKPSGLHPLVLAVNTGDGRVQLIILSRPKVKPSDS